MASAEAAASAATVCAGARVTGRVQLDPGCVVHPNASVLATKGPIRVSSGVIIEELAVVENLSATELVLGPDCVVEVGAVVNASIGAASIVEVQARVEAGASVGAGCVVGVKQVVGAADTLADNSVAALSWAVMQPHQATLRTASAVQHQQHLELLRKLLPTYHRLQTQA